MVKEGAIKIENGK